MSDPSQLPPDASPLTSLVTTPPALPRERPCQSSHGSPWTASASNQVASDCKRLTPWRPGFLPANPNLGCRPSSAQLSTLGPMQDTVPLLRRPTPAQPPRGLAPRPPDLLAPAGRRRRVTYDDDYSPPSRSPYFLPSTPPLRNPPSLAHWRRPCSPLALPGPTRGDLQLGSPKPVRRRRRRLERRLFLPARPPPGNYPPTASAPLRLHLQRRPIAASMNSGANPPSHARAPGTAVTPTLRPTSWDLDVELEFSPSPRSPAPARHSQPQSPRSIHPARPTVAGGSTTLPRLSGSRPQASAP